MRKLFKYLLVTLASLIVVAIVAVVSIVLFLNPNNYKNMIAKQASKAIGRTVVINGDIQWSFFPWLGIDVNQVTISNAPGFGDKPFAELGQAQATVKLMPLFSGKIETGKITLQNLNVNLSKNAQGQTNWQDFTNTATPTTTSTQAPTPADTEQPLSFLVSDISVQNTTIHWQNQQNHSQQKFVIQQLESSNINLDGATFPLQIKMTLQNATQQINAELDSSVAINRTKQTADLTDLTFILNNAKVTGGLHASNIFSNFTYKANLTAPTFNAATLLKSLNNTMTFSNNNALTSVSIASQLSGTSNTLNMTNLTAKVDDSTLSGNANISNLERLIGNFALTIDNLNLDNYQLNNSPTSPATTTPVANTTSQASASGTATTANFQAPFAYANLNGTLNINQLTLTKLVLNNVAANIHVKQSVLSVGPVTATIYGGNLRANFVANYSNSIPSYNIAETLASVQIKPLLVALNGSSRIDGTANINANITARGKDNTALMRSLTGNAGFSIQNGSAQGLQIMQALNSAVSAFFRQPLAKSDTSGTSFSNAAATFNINNGVATTNDLVLNSHILNVTGSGSIDLVTQQLDMSLAVTTLTNLIPAVAHLQQQIGGAIPLKVAGTLSSPHVTPDMKVITLKATTQKVGTQIQKVADDLQKSGKDIGKQLKAIFN